MALEENVLDARKEAYIDWLCTPPQERSPGSKQKYADMVGVATETLRRWEKQESFRKAWEARSSDVVGSPERHQSILDVLYQQALSGDTKAAQLYLQATNKMAPPTITVKDDRKASQLSDDQLEELIAAAAAAEREKRVLKAV